MSGAEELNPCFAVRQSAEWVLSQTQLVSIDDGGEMGVCMQVGCYRHCHCRRRH